MEGEHIGSEEVARTAESPVGEVAPAVEVAAGEHTEPGPGGPSQVVVDSVPVMVDDDEAPVMVFVEEVEGSLSPGRVEPEAEDRTESYLPAVMSEVVQSTDVAAAEVADVAVEVEEFALFAINPADHFTHSLSSHEPGGAAPGGAV